MPGEDKIVAAILGAAASKSDSNATNHYDVGVATLDTVSSLIETSGEVAETIVKEIGETIREDMRTTAEEKKTSAEDIEFLELTPEEIAALSAESNEKSDESPEKGTKTEDGTETNGDGLFVNHSEETLGPDGKPIGTLSTILGAGPLGLGNIPLIFGAAFWNPSSGKNLDAKQVRRAATSYAKIQRQITGAAPNLILEFPTFRLRTNAVNEVGFQVRIEMGKSATTWRALAKQDGSSATDPILFGNLKINAKGISANSPLGLLFPLDFSGRAEGILKIETKLVIRG